MGIEVASSFDQQAAIPLDSRAVFVTLADRDSLPLPVRYQGLSVYVEETMKQYTLKGGVENSNWTNAGGASEDSIANLANLIHKNTADIHKIQITGVNA